MNLAEMLERGGRLRLANDGHRDGERTPLPRYSETFLTFLTSRRRPHLRNQTTGVISVTYGIPKVVSRNRARF